MLALILTSQKATPEQLGLLTLIISFNTFIFLFVDFGLSNYLLHRNQLSFSSVEKLRKINIDLSIVVFTISLILALIFYYLEYDEEIVNAVWLTGVNSFFLAYGKIDRAKLQCEHRFKDIFKVDLISRTIGIIFLSLVITFDVNVLYMYLAVVIMVNILALIVIKFITKKRKFTFGNLENDNLKKFCFPQVANSIVNFFTQNLDLILVAHISGLKVSGVYGVIKIMVTKPFQIYTPSMLKVYTPMIVESGRDEEGKIYNQLISRICLVSVVVYLPIGLLGEEILRVLFKLQGEELAVSVCIYIIYTYLRASALPAGIAVVKTGETSKGLYISLIQTGTLLLLFYMFNPDTILDVTLLLLYFQLMMAILIWFFLVKKMIRLNSKEYWLNIALGIVPVSLPYIWIQYAI